MNKRLQELVTEATEIVRSHGAFGESERYEHVNHEKLAELVIQECISICTLIEAQYHRQRKSAFDFTEKSIYGEGETASGLIRRYIERQFGVTGKVNTEPEFPKPERILDNSW